MSTVRYAAGDWHLVVTDQGVIVVGGDLPASLLTRIWEQVSAGRGLAAVLEALTGAFGTSLTAIPSFAVALAESGSVRLAVRGPLTVTVDTGTGVESATGAGVTTWTERVILDAVRVAITPTESSPAPAEFPIRDGVVLAAAVEWLLATDASAAVAGRVPVADVVSDAASAGPVIVTVVEPEPEPVSEPILQPAAEPEPEPAPEPTPAPEPAVEPEAAPAARGPWSNLAAVAPVTAVPTSAPVEAPVESAGGLIDSIPPMLSDDTLLPPEATTVPERAVEPVAEPGGTTTGYDHLWGETVARSVEDAAVRDADDDAAPAAPAEEPAAGDHDGATISLAQARAMRAADSDSTPPLDSAPPPLAPPRAPAPGRIVLSTGQEFVLDRTVVIGRRPRSTRVTGTDLPHLVAVDSPQQDISRSHLELRVEGDSILATDLHTTNGTILHRAGAEPVRIHPGEQIVVVDGDLLDLGDGITVTLHLPGHGSPA
ncbi:hypothetical protein ASD65_11805 [Microbacterium sp. Root61]|uniref:FHA domain-containing protein n=1 Tax=Microbacterium sp. Root61 TaxID=1736570 RepID=UPI0006F3C8B2|nr:FHA domain-containing protein [Microbacterium sp. Root61]KRA25033.1 hypothetical protein ASD65_11805 [Microbacterium sp. Root61]